MSAKTLHELQDEYAADVAESDDLGAEAMRLARLHQKWLSYLNHFKIKAFAQQKKIDAMSSLRQRYYNGELGPASLAEYGWEPWNLKHKVKAELERWLEGDSILAPMREKQFAYEVCLEHCEHVLKGLKDRGFNIKAAIEWRKFEAGL